MIGTRRITIGWPGRTFRVLELIRNRDTGAPEYHRIRWEDTGQEEEELTGNIEVYSYEVETQGDG